MEISSISPLTRVRFWTEVNLLDLTVLLSVMNILSEGNFSVPLVKRFYKSGSDPQSLVTLDIRLSCSLWGKLCFMMFIASEGEGGLPDKDTHASPLHKSHGSAFSQPNNSDTTLSTKAATLVVGLFSQEHRQNSITL